MKQLGTALAILGLVAAQGALGTTRAMTDNPAYFEKVKGTLVSGLLERLGFHFTAGTLQICERKHAPGISVFVCDIDGAQATVTGDKGLSTAIRFTKVKVLYKQSDQGAHREYYFEGTLQEKTPAANLSTPVKLLLWHFVNEPNRLRGSLNYGGYGISAGLEATPE